MSHCLRLLLWPEYLFFFFFKKKLSQGKYASLKNAWLKRLQWEIIEDNLLKQKL